MSKDVIVVAGATGAQGGGLVRAILADPSRRFQVRALTRNTASEKSQALAAAGAEVVAANVDDLESMKRAFDGAYGAYCVTFFWDHFSPERELQQARNMAEASRGLKHVIWSTLEDTRKAAGFDAPTLGGKYKVPHFDSKGEADQFFDPARTTFLLTSFYWDNFIHFGMGPQAGPDGVLMITMPMGNAKLPGIAAEDIGKCAFGIFQRPALIGQTLGIAGEHLTGAEMAAAYSRRLGQEVRYNDVTPEAYRALGFPGADDLGNMFQFKRDFNEAFCAARDPKLARELNPELQTFEQWLAASVRPATAASS